jgi:uncharacterized protein
MTRLLLWPVIFGLTLITAFPGCRSVTTPVSYYSLSSISGMPGEAVAESNRAVSIGIGPLQLPGYLNRTQMMTRVGLHQLEISSLHRWVDYPDRLIQQILGDNLQVLLPHARVVNPPWPAGLKPDIIVSVQFLELIGTADRQVLLRAIWRVTDAAQLPAEQSHRITLAEPMSDTGFDELAAAHSRVLATLCRAVADNLPTSRPADTGQSDPTN